MDGWENVSVHPQGLSQGNGADHHGRVASTPRIYLISELRITRARGVSMSS